MSHPCRLLAPILFCKACESELPSASSSRFAIKRKPLITIISVAVFISEITARAFLIADSNKRRTLSRADIAKALSLSDQFDFLIDIVPREDPYSVVSPMAGMSSSTSQQQPPQPQPQSLEDVSGGLELQTFPSQYHSDNVRQVISTLS
jgi:hypothetical protein